MSATEKHRPQSRIRCSTCGCDIPWDEVVVPDATNYIVHFCGLDCYAEWRTAAALTALSGDGDGDGDEQLNIGR